MNDTSMIYNYNKQHIITKYILMMMIFNNIHFCHCRNLYIHATIDLMMGSWIIHVLNQKVYNE